MAVVIGLGTVAMLLLGRQDDVVTTGITTAVVLVVAAMTPLDAWRQSVLRLIDKVVGVSVGVSSKWLASYLFYRATGNRSNDAGGPSLALNE